MSKPPLAERLLALADRIGRLRLLNHDPEAFHIDRDEIRRALILEARELNPRVEPRAERGRFQSGAIAADGRLIRAERRGRFSACVRESSCPSPTRLPISTKPISPTISAK